MRTKHITEAQVERALAAYHTLYPDEPLPHTPVRAIIYIGTVAGRDLKVYVQEHSDPPYVLTVTWRGGGS